MLEFGSPFTGYKLGKKRKLRDGELIRAIRFAGTKDYEAVQIYRQIGGSSDNKITAKVLKSVADEECVLMGALLRLLYELTPCEEKHCDKAAKEVEDEIKKMKYRTIWIVALHNIQQMALVDWYHWS